MKIRDLAAAIHVAIAALLVCPSLHAQNILNDGGASSTPDDWLLAGRGSRWWYQTQPSISPVILQKGTPTNSEQVVIDRARTLFANKPAKAIVLMDGNKVLYAELKAPADDDSYFSGFSIGKTVTAMAVGQAICANKLKFETKVSEVIPELNGKALGNASVHDLLRMASGSAEPKGDSNMWTPTQFEQWKQGDLNLLSLVTEDRVSKAARGVFSEYKPGEYFSYKSTDPYVLGIMVTRATGIEFNQWIQAKILDPMGAAKPGVYQQDKEKNPLSDSGLRLRLEDWMRFALWVKRSSKEPGCFGDFVRAATTTQIPNGSGPNSRKTGKLFGGYGYLTWTENVIAPKTAWASGIGGQRISWHKDSDRMVLVFSNIENWMSEIYALGRDWNQLGN
ncbi:MAG: serine hydrolase [Rhodoferax sp.]|uniref:serine hydrolase domain-containing protein n=1 Tax=Rhodoferax sp. TaxID=50421 RepID=UPI003266CF12